MKEYFTPCTLLLTGRSVSPEKDQASYMSDMEALGKMGFPILVPWRRVLFISEGLVVVAVQHYTWSFQNWDLAPVSSYTDSVSSAPSGNESQCRNQMFMTYTAWPPTMQFECSDLPSPVPGFINSSAITRTVRFPIYSSDNHVNPFFR